MITGRDRVRAALTFSHPDRPPRDLWALPYVQLFLKNQLDDLLERYPLDIDRPELSPGSDDLDLQKYARQGSYTDEWGSIWQMAEPGIVGEVKAPALVDWSRLPHYRPPLETIRNRNWDHVNQLCAASEKFMISSVCARPFERLQFLRGSENLYMDLAEESTEFRTLLELVHAFYLEDVAGWARSEVDAVFLMDDWGSNSSLLIHPEQWRAIFKPIYREYCEIIHDAGKFVFFHSDGHIEAIYEDLIEIGVDALNSQLFCMDIERLAQRFRGRITFWGEIDRQHVLPFGTRQEITQAVHRVRAALEDPQGGVIAQCEWGKDNRRETIEAVFQTWSEEL